MLSQIVLKVMFFGHYLVNNLEIICYYRETVCVWNFQGIPDANRRKTNPRLRYMYIGLGIDSTASLFNPHSMGEDCQQNNVPYQISKQNASGLKVCPSD